jgi:pSer/pThr/pTyr-binding forkhead associated (FHA) protein
MTPPRRLLVSGERGLFAETSTTLGVGETAVVGRSRFTTISAATTPIARRVGRSKLEASVAFRRLSRRHLEIVYESPTTVRIVDRSANGTLLDGARVNGSATLEIADLERRPARLRFGAGEELVLSVATDEAAPVAFG